MTALYFSADRLEQFDQTIKISQKEYKYIFDKILSLDKTHTLASAGDISKIIREIVPTEKIRGLTSILMFLGRFRESTDVDRKSLQEAVVLGLENANCQPEKILGWKEISDSILDIVFSRIFLISIKATDLFFEHSFHIHKMRCIVNARPVFDTEDISKVEGYILWSDLHLQISDADTSQNFTIAMSQEDVEVMFA